MSKARRVGFDVMVGFTVVIVLLSVGMGLTVGRIEETTSRALARVHAEQDEITLIERLRWSGEQLVSAGRGYLISADPDHLAHLNAAQTEFEAALRVLEKMGLSPVGATLTNEIGQAAGTFSEIQKRLIRERRAGDLASVVEQFEAELGPARHHLGETLDRLVGYKSARVEVAYAEIERARGQEMAWMYALFLTLVAGSVGVAAYSARKLGRTYRREADALDTASKALKARDELMSIVAHDLRSPLGAITMRAELLQATTVDEGTRLHATSINTTATRMAHLITSMLDLTSIDAGQLTINKAPCDVDGLVQESVDMFSSVAASKQIQLEQRPFEHDLMVEADRERVFQVLSNLLGNALKFTPKGGRVTISIERSDDMVTFAVADTGPGIAAEHVPHVFERYWKHETKGTKGTGLGLFIAKSIIEAHGGTIWVESSPGHGATFRFTLRRVTPSATAT